VHACLERQARKAPAARENLRVLGPTTPGRAKRRGGAPALESAMPIVGVDDAIAARLS
jgi:hypothetical protein